MVYRPEALSRGEVLRKSIHIAFGIILAFLFDILPLPYDIIFLSVGLALSVIYDVVRVRIRYTTPFQSVVEIVARSSETVRVGGQTYFFAGALTAALLFKKEFVFIAIAVTGISDGISSIIGRLYGRVRYKKLSLEGVIAGLAGGVLFTLLYTGLSLRVIGVAVAIVLSEISSLYFNDNLTYPLLVGLILELSATFAG